MKVIIPVAGLGSRLKPHTHTVPKPLLDVAGRPILEYIIEDALKLDPTEIIFVVGHMKETIKKYILTHYPQINCSFVYQKTRDGDGSAIRLALEKIDHEEDLFILFGDTLVDFDIKFSLDSYKKSDAVIFCMEVEDPVHYGIVNVKENMEIYQVEEKPENPKSNLALIGAYYFKSILQVKHLLNEFYQKKETVKGEYKLVQVIEKYAKQRDTSIKASPVKKWFDCGRIEVLLEANKYFLKLKSKGEPIMKGTSIILPPSFVSQTAIIENSVIGPYASIGEGAKITDSIVKNSIICPKVKIENLILTDSLLGKDVIVHGRPSKINIGEKSEISLN